MSAPDVPSPYNLYAPLVIGSLINVFGFGLFMTLAYFDNRPAEGRGIKTLFVLTLNLGQTIADCARLVKITSIHVGDVAFFANFHRRPEELIGPLLTLLIITICQLFLVRRCLLFANVTVSPANRGNTRQRIKTWLIGGLLGAGVALGAGSGLAVLIEFWVGSFLAFVCQQRLPNFAYTTGIHSENTSLIFRRLTTIWYSSISATDVMLSTLIVYELRKAVRAQKGSNDDQHDFVHTLVRVAFQGGIVVTALQIVALICFLSHTSAWSDFPTIFIAKVYSITFLASVSRPRQIVRLRSTPICNDDLPPPVEQQQQQHDGGRRPMGKGVVEGEPDSGRFPTNPYGVSWMDQRRTYQSNPGPDPALDLEKGLDEYDMGDQHQDQDQKHGLVMGQDQDQDQRQSRRQWITREERDRATMPPGTSDRDAWHGAQTSMPETI
ncbi:hypothetical protein IAR55_004852 [Kwoniella newhampshirensis]|uniref:DUF6534 domain-containing protein n=1 Tax=Kwoniella newhampshirensis TaxID=1651941 RepID=A0AAW0YUD0_9TREE